MAKKCGKIYSTPNIKGYYLVVIITTVYLLININHLFAKDSISNDYYLEIDLSLN